ncbi:hypothetical protein [Streptomyces altiplanensis]
MPAGLAQAGRVRADEQDKGPNGPRVHAVAGGPLPGLLLRAADERAAEHVRGVQALLVEIGTRLRATVLDRLAERVRAALGTARSPMPVRRR